MWTRFNSGDRAAFSEIYEQFIDSLFAYGYKLQKNNKLQSIPLESTGNTDFKFEVEQDVFELESDHLRLEKLKIILATLDPQKRELLYLNFNSGLNYYEIGQIFNMHSDTVKKQIYRLIEQIRGKYGAQLFELLVISGR